MISIGEKEQFYIATDNIPTEPSICKFILILAVYTVYRGL